MLCLHDAWHTDAGSKRCNRAVRLGVGLLDAQAAFARTIWRMSPSARLRRVMITYFLANSLSLRFVIRSKGKEPTDVMGKNYRVLDLIEKSTPPIGSPPP
jgi:hypothetical protein